MLSSEYFKLDILFLLSTALLVPEVLAKSEFREPDAYQG
jgi:hypothetical protein